MDASQFLPPYNPCRRSRYPPSIRIVSKIPVMKITMHLEKRDATLRTKKEIIAYLSQLAAAAGKIDDMDRYITAVLQREETASTAVGFKIAIPHGESDAVTQTFVACVQLKHPVVWDHDEVDLVFMIGVPLSSRNKEHLRILAMLSRHLMKEDFRRELREAKTDDEFYERIKFLENER